MYQRDPILVALGRELDRARAVLAAAQQTNVRLDEARKHHENAQVALERYQGATSLLNEAERQYAVSSGLGAVELVQARWRVPADYYSRAVAGAPGALSIRDCLTALARAKPAAPDAKIVTDVMKALEAAAQAIRSGMFVAQLVRTLATAAAALAKAKGEDPATVAELVAAVKAAFTTKNATAARKALDAIVEHFSLAPIDAPAPPVTSSRSATQELVRGADVGLFTRIC